MTKRERIVHVALGTIPIGTIVGEDHSSVLGRTTFSYKYAKGGWKYSSPNRSWDTVLDQNIVNYMYINKGR